MARTFRPIIGKQNIGTQQSSAGALNRQFRQSFGVVMRNFDRLIKHIEGATPEILVDVMEPTFGKAIEYTPKDTHDLVNSSFMEVETFRGNSVIAIGFGRGGDPGYAIYVHEMPYTHEAPTRPKFLQSAVDEDLHEIPIRLQQAVKLAAGT